LWRSRGRRDSIRRAVGGGRRRVWPGEGGGVRGADGRVRKALLGQETWPRGKVRDRAWHECGMVVRREEKCA
jgi:hypothetical protein